MQVGPWVVPSNQHVIFSINRLINTVTNDNMEWTKPQAEYRHQILIDQSICYSIDA